jgi:predicted O-methyltransferase YrrM
MKELVKKMFKKIAYKFLFLGIENYKTWVPPGHFYSPIPSITEIKANEEKFFSKHIAKEIPGINLNEKEQINLLEEFKNYYKELPFEAYKQDNLRFFYENPNYCYSDAIFLYCMIRYAKPKKIIEVGSGYSSCVVLDTNELFYRNAISCTFIEPYPQLLLSLIKDSDKDRIEIVPERLQNLEISKFNELSAGDILFIDSTHVAKVGSDVNYIFSHILPYIKSGVYIHFHDIFYPFEYPKDWIYEGRAWNEAYILKAFLQYNNSFDIVFFNTFLQMFYKDKFFNEMPLCMKNTGGSIWLKKT